MNIQQLLSAEYLFTAVVLVLVLGAAVGAMVDHVRDPNRHRRL